MWLYRTFCAGAICLMLASCGFQPLYGDGGRIASTYSTIEIANIPDHDGQYLRNLLIDRLYAESQMQTPRYLLSVRNLKKRIVSLGIRKDATSTRGQMETTATVTLTDKVTGETILTRNVTASGGYNRLDDRFATLVSEADRTELILKELSGVIITEIDLYLTRTAATP